MTDKQQSTDPYKGVRDFYPEDAAIRQYIFNNWSKTAESFGFERYDASILEPSDLYKAKGAENEELVNEQTYTFTDRGDREVTLRPEMTPTVARMVAAKARELAFPLRWYSIPNLFRYERPQRGRLREHWQLNCDIFGSDDIAADVEIIALAYQTLTDFGATPDMFEIRINSRKLLQDQVTDKLVDPKEFSSYLQLLDKKSKMSPEEFVDLEKKLLKDCTELNIERNESISEILKDLEVIGVSNAIFDSTITRGFNYYTDTVFEVFDTSDENNRALLGGGRYNNLTSMFGCEPISGIGFGMGDVTMRDFLETHNLLPENVKSTGAKVAVIPMNAEQNLNAQKVASQLRSEKTSVSVDIGTQKADKKKARAAERGSKFIIVVGENEAESEEYTLKNLETGEEKSDTIKELIQSI